MSNIPQRHQSRIHIEPHTTNLAIQPGLKMTIMDDAAIEVLAGGAICMVDGAQLRSGSALNGVHAATAPNIAVMSVAGFPAAGTVQIDSELISYASVNTSLKRLEVITRGAFGTTPAPHNNGVAVTTEASAIADSTPVLADLSAKVNAILAVLRDVGIIAP
jgi:hypothetical protein